MKKRKPSELDRLRRPQPMSEEASLDPSSIDRLYGLEPVYEPDTGSRGVVPEEFATVQCPYCGERLETRVDLTADELYIEDCQVCCRPIEFSIERAENGGLSAVRARRLD